LAELRSLQDWFLKLELSGVEGVSEVASVGGFEREYQVLIDPNKLESYDVSIAQLARSIRAASSEVGGRVLEQGETEYVIRSSGYVKTALDTNSRNYSAAYRTAWRSSLSMTARRSLRELCPI